MSTYTRSIFLLKIRWLHFYRKIHLFLYTFSYTTFIVFVFFTFIFFARIFNWINE